MPVLPASGWPWHRTNYKGLLDVIEVGGQAKWSGGDDERDKGNCRAGRAGGGSFGAGLLGWGEFGRNQRL